MAKKRLLQDAFVAELRDVYHGEHQVLKALPKVIRKTRPGALRETLASHLLEAKGHVDRLERVFAAVGEKPKGRRCEGMAGIVAENKSAMKEDFDEATMDACVVAAAQRVGHYQMAAYGTLTLWARTLGHHDAMALLAATLAEEKAASERLSSLVDTGPHALAAGPDGEQDGQNTRLTKRLKTARTKK